MPTVRGWPTTESKNRAAPLMTERVISWAKAFIDLPVSSPAYNIDVFTGMNWLYQGWRNKITQATGTVVLFDDAGTTGIASYTTTDDGSTFTRTEVQ